VKFSEKPDGEGQLQDGVKGKGKLVIHTNKKMAEGELLPKGEGE